MKKFLFALVLFVTAAFAEPSFDEMQNLIAQKNYAAAEQGLEVIIKNHPNSAKAFYSMAQAQAGLGHQDKAQFALNKAKGLDPALKFATINNVEALQVAITPQVKKIEKVEAGVSWWVIFFTTLAFGLICWLVYIFFKKDDKPTPESHFNPEPTPTPPDNPSDRAYMKDHNLDTEEIEKKVRERSKASYIKPKYEAVRTTPLYSPPLQPTTYVAPPVVNNHYGSNSDGLVTGMMIGSMMNNHHDTTRVIEREVIVERPSYTPSYTPPTRSSSWDDDSSSSKSSSSSWSSSSSDSSSSSSSWDSGSSSSSSSSDSSSSSWD
jgi:hypothetical protein